jgi:hypothetical protein
MTFYKATRPNGTDFYTGDIDYAEALTSSESITHPLSESITHPLKSVKRKDDARYYLSVSTVPTDCTGMKWPCRLFEVEPVGKTWVPAPNRLPNKVACKSLRVVRELDSWRALGPQGAQLRDLVDQARILTEPQVRGLSAAWDDAGVAAWDASRVAAWDASRAAAWDATGVAARAAAWDASRVAAGLQSRDLIGTRPGWDQDAYDLLTGPWRKAIGRIHHDDEEMT